MLNCSELKKCRAAEIPLCDAGTLKDLKSVTVDTAMPIKERMESFVKQVNNPYLFKVGDTVIKVSYCGDRDISQVLAGIISAG